MSAQVSVANTRVPAYVLRALAHLKACQAGHDVEKTDETLIRLRQAQIYMQQCEAVVKSDQRVQQLKDPYGND